MDFFNLGIEYEETCCEKLRRKFLLIFEQDLDLTAEKYTTLKLKMYELFTAFLHIQPLWERPFVIVLSHLQENDKNTKAKK